MIRFGRNHPQRTMNTCTIFQGNAYYSCRDISVSNKLVLSRLSNNAIWNYAVSILAKLDTIRLMLQYSVSSVVLTGTKRSISRLATKDLLL